jgi:hypothetical protein
MSTSPESSDSVDGVPPPPPPPKRVEFIDDNSQSSDAESTHHGSFDASPSPPAIAAKETRALFISRVVVGLLLLVLGAGAAFCTFFFTAKGESIDFETEVCEKRSKDLRNARVIERNSFFFYFFFI